MNFEIGQVFEDEYPPEAAIWCNEIGKVHIEEIEPVDDVQRFQIVANPEPTDDEIADQVRHKRDRLIAETDYLLCADYPVNEEDLKAVKAYRQALRDVPQQEGFPTVVEWPQLPAILSRCSG